MTDGRDTGREGIDAIELGIMIVLVSLMLQCFLIFSAFTDKRLLFHIEKIKDNEERFQSLINHNIDPIYVFSLEGKMLSANSSGYSLLEKMGVEPERLSSFFDRRIMTDCSTGFFRSEMKNRPSTATRKSK